MQSRLTRFRQELSGCTAIIHKPENMRYLSGFLGEGALLIGQDVNMIVTDFRYTEAAATQAPGWEIVMSSNELPQNQILAERANKIGKPIFWEEDFLTIREGKELGAKLDPAMKPLEGLVEALRIVKDDDEIATMAKASAITDAAFAEILTKLKPGLTEKQVALMLYNAQIERGASDLSFSTIVASGENASLPHAIPTDRVIQRGDVVTMDFGCKVNGYCSDFTRTVAIGEISPKLKEIYKIVLDANLMALDGLKPGKTGVAVDKIARDYIAKHGYGEYFGHGLGHGVGLMIHEAPRLSPVGKTVLEPGMAVTVEPGIYLPGIGGVRIEDLCIVTEKGYRNLCASPKELITL